MVAYLYCILQLCGRNCSVAFVEGWPVDCDALTVVLGILIQVGTKFYIQVEDIPICTICASLFANLFLFCNEGNFMMSLSDIIHASSIYLEDNLNINNIFF